MDETKTQQRHRKACGIKASRVCKEFNAASSVEHNNANQLNMVVVREQTAVKQRIEMLDHSSVVLDTGDSQCIIQQSESDDLLEIQYVRQGLIRHVDVRDHRWQVAFPVHVPPVDFEKFFG